MIVEGTEDALEDCAANEVIHPGVMVEHVLQRVRSTLDPECVRLLDLICKFVYGTFT